MRIRLKEISKAVYNKILSIEEERAEERKKICETCPLNQGGICSGCGCVIALKVYSDNNSCPEHKWNV